MSAVPRIPAWSPFVALRYLLTRPIMVLAVAGVTFAVWAILVVDAVFSGFVTEIRTDVARSSPDLLLTDLPHDTGYERLRAVLEADADVAATSPRLRHHGLLECRRKGDDRIDSSAIDFDDATMDSGFALLLGIDPLREAAVVDLPSWFERGYAVLEARDHLHELEPCAVLAEPDPARRAQLLVPDAVEWHGRRRAGLPAPERAEDHRSSFPGLLLGWRRYPHLPLPHGEPLELLVAAYGTGEGGAAVDARLARLAFAGWFATGHRLFDETQAMLPIETLRTLLGHDIADDRAIDLVTDVAIRTAAGLSPAAITACAARLQQRVQQTLPPGSAPCTVLDWQQQNRVFLGAVAQEHRMMQFVLFVVMVVAAFVIYATLHMMVVQKWKDIGIFAAIGGTPRGVGLVFVGCGAAVGAIGAVLGALAGVVSARSLNAVDRWLGDHVGVQLFPADMFDLRVVPIHQEPETVALVALAALALAVLVAVVPARKAAAMNPVKALSYE